MATLDGRDRGLRNIRRRGEVGLTPAAASAQGPNDQSDSSVVHFDMLAPVPYPRPIAGFRGCSTVRRLMRDTVRRSRPADDWSPTRSATPQEDLIRGQGDDHVAKYEPLLEVITDKVNAEVPSPVEGTLTAILVEEGATVPNNAEIAVIETAGEAEVGSSAGAS